jgi:DNA polymerase-3 subunit epsilon/ATP-dependent DNA helicase DinG
MSMALHLPSTSPFELTHVALDLETTGLDQGRDTIIEVGAVKFEGDRILDTFQTFVNPGRNIPEFVQRLTGISNNQVKRAPFFSSVADELGDFVENHPIIGHNVSFDLGFLGAHGLPLQNLPYDTWDLASVLLPNSPQYSLGFLSDYFGVSHVDRHRALGDARATYHVFIELLRRAERLDSGLITHMVNLSNRSQWPIGGLFSGLPKTSAPGQPSAFGLTGLDLEALTARLGRPEQRRSESNLSALDQDQIINLLGANGPFAKTFSGFEHRPEQEVMLAGVARAIHQSQHLVVEGGTGVGKSMAYLLPAVLFAMAKGQRVVVSTNTINLQEQLLKKDIPALVSVLEAAGLVAEGQVKAALLKGRGNYLCLHRWNYLARSENPTVDDTRLLCKTAVWLQDTATGDRGEINLSGRDAFTWNRVSAGEKTWCPGLRDGGPCFLRAARERAEQAHIIVVNHALLMSDLVRGGSLIPDYQYLIVDEAHNLEDEATRQLGFEVPPERLEEITESQGRLLTQLRLALAAETLASPVRQEADGAISDVETSAPAVRESWARLWAVSERLLDAKRPNSSDERMQLLLDRQVQGLPVWSDLLLEWENLDVRLQQAGQRLSRLQRFLETATLPGASDQPALAMEAGNIQDDLEQLRERLGSILGPPDDRSIFWMARDQNRAEVSLHAAPLDVGATLNEELFNRKECVVMTSATLSTEGNFDYFRRRAGIPEGSEELLVGSPFDYQKAALLLIPDDMPPPNADGYVEALARVLIELGKSLGGRTMALFTSYASLRAVANRIRAPLGAEGVQVLAQSIDGPPQQLIGRFSGDPKSVLLGTASFWEGVDLPSGVLKALVLTRLPFQVPTDPVVKARADQYADPFQEFSIPQAVLKFRQGMGRLVRNKGDKGAIVVLDRRITGRSYGHSFLQSIPPCTMKPSNLTNVGPLAAQWVGDHRGANH